MSFKVTLAGSNDSASARFNRKVTLGDGCWEWKAAPNRDGYGRFRLGGTGSKELRAHVVAFHALHGTEPDPEYEVHHECANRTCVRPDHLKLMPVDDHRRLHHEQVRTKPECLNGHDLTKPENVYRWKGVRHCRPCKRNRDRIALGIPPERWRIPTA